MGYKGYIVPKELPKNCGDCSFSFCRFAHNKDWKGEKPNLIGYSCSLLEGIVIEMDYGDRIRPECCPLEETEVYD